MISRSEIINRFINKHGNKYDYSLYESHTKVTDIIKIICNEHGIFKQSIHNHTMYGCIKCGGSDKNNTESFIKSAILIHENKYDYSKTKYINNKNKIIITCKEHGDFLQTPNNHISKKIGCSFCSGKKIFPSFYLKKIKLKWGDKYQYQIFYKKSDILNLTCNKHGNFNISVSDHLNRECDKCEFEKRIKTISEIHGDRYDYSNIKFIKNTNSILEIKCKIHGEFRQTYKTHLKSGCLQCGIESSKLSLDKFIKRSIEIHGDKYNYSKSIYNNIYSKLLIKCSKHGFFKQEPKSHLRGSGCPICKSSKGEIKILNFLDDNKIKYVTQYKFNDCRNKLPLPFDFYLPELNTCIEYDGILHFKSIDIFGGEEALRNVIINDSIKTQYCLDNNINLIRIAYTEFNKIEKKLNLLILNTIIKG